MDDIQRSLRVVVDCLRCSQDLMRERISVDDSITLNPDEAAEVMGDSTGAAIVLDALATNPELAE